jgi:hypothetical protein
MTQFHFRRIAQVWLADFQPLAVDQKAVTPVVHPRKARWKVVPTEEGRERWWCKCGARNPRKPSPQSKAQKENAQGEVDRRIDTSQ